MHSGMAVSAAWAGRLIVTFRLRVDGYSSVQNRRAVSRFTGMIQLLAVINNRVTIMAAIGAHIPWWLLG